MQTLAVEVGDPTPFWESLRFGIQLYQRDCAEVLPTLQRGSVDLLLTDPPYGVEWQSRRRLEAYSKMQGDDGAAGVLAALQQSMSLLPKRRHAYIFGPWRAEDFLFGGASVELIWDKAMLGLGNLSLPYGPSHERILFGVYTPSKYDREHGDGRLTARRRRGTILRYPRANSRAVRHPSEKPVGLLRELIESSSCRGETVFDPFCGVGSTLVAAALEGRKAIGVEIDPQYCKIAAERLEAVTQALSRMPE